MLITCGCVKYDINRTATLAFDVDESVTKLKFEDVQSDRFSNGAQFLRCGEHIRALGTAETICEVLSCVPHAKKRRAGTKCGDETANTLRKLLGRNLKVCDESQICRRKLIIGGLICIDNSSGNALTQTFGRGALEKLANRDCRNVSGLRLPPPSREPERVTTFASREINHATGRQVAEVLDNKLVGCA